MKRILVCLLVLLCLSAAAVSVRAAEGESGWEYDKETLTLYIYGEGSTADIKYDGWGKTVNPRTVIIGEGITAIGKNAFYSCTNLRSVQLPSTLKEIGESAFHGTSFEEFEVPEGVTKIGERAFAGCKYMKSIQLPSSLTEIGAEAFWNAGLTECQLPKGIKTLNEATFLNCRALTKVVLNNGLTKIGRFAFEKCSSLNSVTIPDSVTAIGEEAFGECTSLTAIHIPDSVTELGEDVFGQCTALETVRLSNRLVYIYNGLFSGCSSLKTLEIPDSVEHLGTAFFGCKALEEIYIGKGVEKLDWHHFDGCEQLKRINISSKNKRYTSVDGIVYSKDKTTLELVPEGFEGTLEVLPGTLRIQRAAAKDHQGLTAVIVADSVTFIGASAFENCKNLETVVLGSGVEQLDGAAFSDCEKLKNLTLNEGLKELGDSVFSSCRSLKNVTVPASVTLVRSYAFRDCKGLKRIEFLGDKPEIMHGAFMLTRTEAYHPEENTTWDDGRLNYEGYLTWPQDPSYEKYAGKCGELLRWELNPDTGVLTISGQGKMGDFSNTFAAVKDQVKAIVLEEGVLDMIRMDDMKNIESIILPASVRQIADKAFYHWNSLSRIEILGDGVVIGREVFYYCPALHAIRFTGNVPSVGPGVFDGYAGFLYYPAGNATWNVENWVVDGWEILHERMICVPEGEVPNQPTQPEGTETIMEEKKNPATVLIWLMPVAAVVIVGITVTVVLLRKKK